jgi:uncharacterized protein (DUF111 family)
MTEAITTGVFGTLILAAIVYLGSRVDRLSDRIDSLAERVARIEGRLDERETHGT